MTLENFDYIVDKTILERGILLFNKNAVKYLDSYACSRKFKVQGSEIYDVEISFRKDLTINYLECNCPFAQKHKICKHEVACLLYIRKMENIKRLE